MSVDAIAISRTALDVEWQRMQVIAQNLANQNTSRVAGGGTYRALRLTSGPAGAFANLISPGSTAASPQGVRVVAVEADNAPARLVHDPGHPDADANGFVSYPDIDHAAEMARLVKTSRIYESNLTALTLAREMNMRALEIGKQ